MLFCSVSWTTPSSKLSEIKNKNTAKHKGVMSQSGWDLESSVCCSPSSQHFPTPSPNSHHTNLSWPKWGAEEIKIKTKQRRWSWEDLRWGQSWFTNWSFATKKQLHFTWYIWSDTRVSPCPGSSPWQLSMTGTSAWDIWVTSKCAIKYLKNSLILLLADVRRERGAFARHIVLQYLSKANFCTFFIGSSKSCPDCFALRLNEPSPKGELRIDYHS